MIHLERFAYALKPSWLKHFMHNSNTKIFLNANLSPFGKEFLFNCNFTSSDKIKINNIFVREVCVAWLMAPLALPTTNFEN